MPRRNKRRGDFAPFMSEENRRVLGMKDGAKMAEIKPFRGIRYAWQDLEEGEIGRLVAPPYDVVDSEEQESLYQSHPANIVRLDLNRIQPDDDDENNRYVR